MEERKQKLAAEGLFDEARKQLLPFLPAVIGVITSPTGAVIRDILHRLADRFPRHVLRLAGQGAGRGLGRRGRRRDRRLQCACRSSGGLPPRPDLIIVARGGGSLEDLWSFNEEIVVRAAAASFIPLISAVGHETDVTLIDFAADRRAPTPTAAAEMAVPVRAELLVDVDSLARRGAGRWRRNQEARRSRIARGGARAAGRRRSAGDAAAAARSCRGGLAPRAARQRADPSCQLFAHRRPAECAIAADQCRAPARALRRHRVAAARRRRREYRRPSHPSRPRPRARRRVRRARAARRSSIHRGAAGARRARRPIARGIFLSRRAGARLCAGARRGGPAAAHAAAVGAGMPIEIEFADGRVGARADGAPSAVKPGGEPAKPRARRGGGPGQGDLF